MRSERMTLLVTPKEKSAIAAEAKRLGVSTSELVRRAVEVYDPDADQAALRALAAELAAAVRASGRKLDGALKRLHAIESRLADPERLRADARAEIERGGLTWPFDPGERPSRPARRAGTSAEKTRARVRSGG